MKPRVVLLNPPATRPVLRDGYCSLVGRWSYSFHPMDLLVQAGLLAPLADLAVVDAIAERLAPEAALARVLGAEPELVLSLVGSAGAAGDRAFLAQVRDRLPQATLIGSGDLVQYDPQGGLAKLPMLDGALLDFTAPDLLESLGRGGSAMAWPGEPPPPSRGGRFAYGIPPYALFPEHRYRLPYRPGRLGSPLASFGCPFGCSFCNTSQVQWKVREPEDLGRELHWLAQQGVAHAYVRDATFGAEKGTRAETIAVLRDSGLTWNTFTRIDLWDGGEFEDLYRAGCRVLQLGLEVEDEAHMRRLGKPLRRAHVRERVRAAQKAGIAVCGHFMVGLPSQSLNDMRKTVRYALSLGCDFANFNVAEPRPGAPFSGQQPGLASWQVRPEAHQVRARAMRRFYTHPRTLWRTARRLRSPAELGHTLRQAATLMRG